jgi:flagellar operon protein
VITLTDKPFLISQPIKPIGLGQPKKMPKPISEDKNLFNEVLQKEIADIGDLKFSRHAQERIETRQIKLEQTHLLRLKEAMAKAQTKGARESLILLDDLAFVVSIKNKTVITAVDSDSRRGNVFTNIDSAVIN